MTKPKDRVDDDSGVPVKGVWRTVNGIERVNKMLINCGIDDGIG